MPQVADNLPETLLVGTQAVLFDLDGTLVDTAPDLTTSINLLLAEDRLPALAEGLVRRMVGDGVARLVERAYAASGNLLLGSALEEKVAEMKRIYGMHLTDRSTTMPGAIDCIRLLHERGLMLGVVTNKPDFLARRILDHFGFSPWLSVVRGSEPSIRRKPAPDMLIAARAMMGASGMRTVVVGDGANDLLAGRAAGLPVILVRSDYGPVSVDDLAFDLVIDSLDRLPDLICAEEAGQCG